MNKVINSTILEYLCDLGVLCGVWIYSPQSTQATQSRERNHARIKLKRYFKHPEKSK